MTLAIILSITIITLTLLYNNKKAKNNFNIIKKDTVETNESDVIKKQAEEIPQNKYDDYFLKQEFLELFYTMQEDFKQENFYYKNNCCPKCGCVFEKEIKSSKKCPECKSVIAKRSNSLTKEQYLMDDNKFLQFQKLETKISDLRFYENLLKRYSYSIPNLKNLIKNIKSKHKINSIRDLIWILCNDIDEIYTQKGTEWFKKAIKQKDILEKSQIMQIAMRDFRTANLSNRIRIIICERANKNDIIANFISTYLHHSISIELLYYINNDFDILPSKEEVRNIVSTKEIVQYMITNDLSLEELKTIYIKSAHNFIIPTITVDNSWKIVESALKN